MNIIAICIVIIIFLLLRHLPLFDLLVICLVVMILFHFDEIGSIVKNIFGGDQNSDHIRIANWNVMSEKASNFIKPTSMGKINRQEMAGETVAETEARFNAVLDKLSERLPSLDIVAFEEATPKFKAMYDQRVNKSPVFNEFDVYYYETGNLMTLVKKKKFSHVFAWDNNLLYKSLRNIDEHAKVQLLTIKTANNTFLFANVHLNGDPLKKNERRGILNAIESYGIPSLIIGDFNESRESFGDWKGRGTLINVDDGMSSYSRFNYDDKSCPIKFGCSVTKKANPWESIDNLVYGNNMRITQKRRMPSNMNGLEVPYKCDDGCNIPYKMVPNYNVWPSDHSLNIYGVEILPV